MHDQPYPLPLNTAIIPSMPIWTVTLNQRTFIVRALNPIIALNKSLDESELAYNDLKTVDITELQVVNA